MQVDNNHLFRAVFAQNREEAHSLALPLPQGEQQVGQPRPLRARGKPRQELARLKRWRGLRVQQNQTGIGQKHGNIGRVKLRVEGMMREISADDLGLWTARNGIAAAYTHELLFADEGVLAAAHQVLTEDFASPQPLPLYLEFLDNEIGWGAFADRAIAEGELVGEYTGVLTEAVRGNDYSMIYPLLNEAYVIDATYFGNETRFINHGSQPNCAFTVRGGRMFFVATQPIPQGAQVLTDYGSDYWQGVIPREL